MQPGITHTGLFYTFSPGPSTQPPAHTTDVSAVGTDSQLPTVLTHQSERVDSEISSEQLAEPESCSSSDSEPDTHISDEEPSSTSCQGNFQHTQSLVPDDVSCTDDTPFLFSELYKQHHHCILLLLIIKASLFKFGFYRFSACIIYDK